MWTTLVPRKGSEFPWIAKRAARFINHFGHNMRHVQLRQSVSD